VHKVCSDRITSCNPVARTGCAGGTGCYVVTSTELTGCHAAGPGGQGAACTTNYDCQAGYACVDDPSRCYKMCRAGNDGDCKERDKLRTRIAILVASQQP
jgi:hypothetical protein